MSRDSYEAYVPSQPSNTLGVAGFVCALVGLLTGGHLLSPIGLILSVVALGYRPRGWAIAGLIVGLLGTCGWAIVAVFAILVAATVGLGMAGVFFFSQADRIELTTDMAKIAMQAEDYKRDNRGIVPADLAVLTLQPNTLIDPWGHAYRYELHNADPGFDIVSDGPDGKAGTEDDVRLSNLENYWKGAGEDFKRELEHFEKRQNTTIRIGPETKVTVGGPGSGFQIQTGPGGASVSSGAGTQPASQPAASGQP